jgi:hypothetical protein
MKPQKPSLEALIQVLQSLPEATQQRYISEFMAKLEADAQWEATFNSPESIAGLKRLAIETEAEIAAGNYGEFYTVL